MHMYVCMYSPLPGLPSHDRSGTERRRHSRGPRILLLLLWPLIIVLVMMLVTTMMMRVTVMMSMLTIMMTMMLMMIMMIAMLQ